MPKFIFAGDTVIRTKKEKLVSSELEKIIKDHDVACLNLEAPIESDGKPIAKIGPNISQPGFAADLITGAGFNMLCLANNHIFDFGSNGLEMTLRAFPSQKMVGAGKDFSAAYKPEIMQIDGVKFGFLAFSENGFGAIDREDKAGFAWVNHAEADNIIKKTKASCDVLFVQVHAGVENIDLPLPEWRQRYRRIIDLGADIVVGHHPHMLQGREEYGSGLIFYSLGNFIFEINAHGSSWNKGCLLSIEYQKGKLAKTSVILTDAKSGMVEKEISSEDVFENLNRRLGAGYSADIDAAVAGLWRERLEYFFQRSLNGFSDFKGMIRSVIFYVLGKEIDKDLLWHNLNIESHLWAARRAIGLLKK